MLDKITSLFNPLPSKVSRDKSGQGESGEQQRRSKNSDHTVISASKKTKVPTRAEVEEYVQELNACRYYQERKIHFKLEAESVKTMAHGRLINHLSFVQIERIVADCRLENFDRLKGSFLDINA